MGTSILSFSFLPFVMYFIMHNQLQVTCFQLFSSCKQGTTATMTKNTAIHTQPSPSFYLPCTVCATHLDHMFRLGPAVLKQ